MCATGFSSLPLQGSVPGPLSRERPAVQPEAPAPDFHGQLLSLGLGWVLLSLRCLLPALRGPSLQQGQSLGFCLLLA